MARKSFTRKQKSNILIVCEGTTEEKGVSPAFPTKPTLRKKVG